MASAAELRNIYERLREVETTLSGHLARCKEASEHSREALVDLRQTVHKACSSIAMLEQNQTKVKGVGLALRWVAGLLGAASVFMNIYLTLKLLAAG